MSPISTDSANAQPSSPTWAVMVVAGAQQYTDAAISDVLAQAVPTKLLLIGQGLDQPFREHLERICEEYPEQVYGWWFNPALSLAAAWNRGLNFAWECGGNEAFVVNNDVRLRPETIYALSTGLRQPEALFVSGVGVTAEQFDMTAKLDIDLLQRGGPDFSCFMMSREAHQKYPFDEAIYPCYTEDLDLHRRYMLGGDGDKIFSINLPYLHYASGTLKEMSPEARMKKERAIDGARAYYQKKWGGPVNGERYTLPFDPESAQDGVTTPDLQRMAQKVTEAVSASR